MLRLSLQYVIWWWHLVFKVEYVPELTTKLAWLVKIISLQKLEWDSMCVGSEVMYECKTFKLCTLCCSFGFFPPRWRCSIKAAKDYCKKGVGWSTSNLVLHWLGDLQTTPIYPLQSCKKTLQVIHWLRFDNFTRRTLRDSLR